MGLLVDGQWQDKWYDTKKDGRFVRQESRFRNDIQPEGRFTPEPGRYHLYVSYACPWAHRTLIFRALLGLKDAIGVTVVHPEMLSAGWEMRDDCLDDLLGLDKLYDLYLKAAPDYSGRVTVPVLWDKQEGTIVNNESSEIIRMMNVISAPNSSDLWPEALRPAIETVNERVYRDVNNGVYRTGFATTQEAYEEAVEALFSTLDWLEASLEGKSYLVADLLTEADIRLFTTLVRFDAVYYSHFKCSRRRLVEYPNLWAHTRRIYQLEGVAETVRMDHIRHHYFFSHTSINPYRIVPVMPEIDFMAPLPS